MSLFKKKDKSDAVLRASDETNVESKVVDAEVHLDIPDDEIWTYKIDGLAAPNIGGKYSKFTFKKILFTLVIIVAVSLSMYFSVRTVQKETFEYSSTGETYELSKFSNTGFITELNVDFVSNVEYDRENEDPATNFKIVPDKTKKITSIGEYALNCDGYVEIIKIGADVTNIDPKAFYSCWALQQIEVDENNPNYCDIDGVLYSKDMTTLICMPCNYDQYRRETLGYENEPYRADATEEYIRDIQTYVVPSTVTTLGPLCMNYTNLRVIYLPEGLKRVETLAVFKLHEPKDQWGNTPSLDNIYTYKSETAVTDTKFTSVEALGEVYKSLPEGLEYIGSDAFSYNQELQYLYIPASVKAVEHHAFWDTLYKNNDTKELCGITEIFVAVDEATFKKEVKTGDSWRPQYDYMLFKKSVSINYSAERAE